jgi:tetratricopeptide (TPR) repeat protein
MKKIHALGICALLAFSPACDRKLDVLPKNFVDAEEALRTPQDVESAVIGGYGRLGDPALYGADYQLTADLLAAENYIAWQGTFQGYREMANKRMNSINTQATRTWTRSYWAINTVNSALEALNLVTDTDLREQLEGEARFIRGVVYFELVRLYAAPWQAGGANTQPGVPIVLGAANTEQEASVQTARATVAQVYTQIIDDLTRAESLLPEDNNTRADKYAAAGFLSRVYLQQSDFARARDAADRVIASDRYRLNPEVFTAFRSRNSAESIFEIQQNNQNNAGTANDGLTTFYASLPGIGRADVRVRPEFAELYDSTDARFTQLIYEGEGARAGLRSGKWTDFYANIPIIRLAELLLTRAECNLRLGTAVGATPLEDVNAVRQRAGVAPYASLTLDQILFERQLELAFEGVRIHDIKRTGGTLERYDSDGVLEEVIQATDPRLVLPIPQREIDANDLLTQNIGY